MITSVYRFNLVIEYLLFSSPVLEFFREIRHSGFNLVIEYLLFSSLFKVSINFHDTLFQSRNRVSSLFKASSETNLRISSMPPFQSRNRVSSLFKGGQTSNAKPACRFQSRNRVSSLFKPQGFCWGGLLTLVSIS